MKKSIILFYLFCFFISTPSCSDNEIEQSIPYVPVSFKINTRNVDNHLASPGNVGIYIPSLRKVQYEEMIENTKVAKIYTTPRSGGANEIYGYSGTLILNTGLTSTESLVAFDLCCPNELLENTRIVPTNDLKARCLKCNSTFDLYANGRAVEGPAMAKKKNLQQYRVIPTGENEFRIIH